MSDFTQPDPSHDEPPKTGHATEQLTSANERSAYAAHRLLAGARRDAVATELEQRGAARTDARHVVDMMYADLVRELDAERPNASTLPIGAAAGIVGAIVGGAVWGLIVYFLTWDIGIFAWAVGLLVGTVMLRATQGRKSQVLQVIAAVCAVLGVVFAKYAIVYLVYRDVASSPVDPNIARTLIDNAGSFFDLFTLVFTALAVFTAWRMLEPTRTNLVRDDTVVVAPAIR